MPEATEREMSNAERIALEAANRILMRMMGVDEDSPHSEGGGGRWIWFIPSRTKIFLKPNQNAYTYWQSPDGWMFCYTKWKDENGDYWTWTWRPIGKGSRSGKGPQRVKPIKIVKARTRKLADARAYKRYQQRIVTLADRAKHTVYKR